MTKQPFKMARVGQHGLVYGAGIVLQKMVGFIMLPVYTRYLTTSDYGVLHLIIMTTEVLSILAGSRIAFGIFHFYHKAESEDQKRRVLSTALLLLLATYVSASAMTLLFAPAISNLVFGSDNHILHVQLAAGILLCESLGVVPMAYLQLRIKSAVFVGVTFSKLILQVTLNIIFVIPLQMGVTGILVSNFIASVVIGTFLVGFLTRHVGLHLSRGSARDLLRVGIPLIGMQVATFVIQFGDRYFLNKAADTSAVGVYGLAYQFSFLLVTAGYVAFARVWDPTRFEIAKRPDRDELYARAFIYVNLVLVTMGMGIVLFTGDFLKVVADPEFHPAARLVPVLIIAYLLQAWTLFQNIGIYIKERTELLMLANWVTAGVAIAGYLWLIPVLLEWGAVLTAIAACATRYVIVYMTSQRLWSIRYRWGPVLRLVTIALALNVASVIIPTVNVVLSIAIHAAMFTLFLGIVWNAGILSEGDRKVVVRTLSERLLPRLRLRT